MEPNLNQYVKVRDEAIEMAARQGVTHYVNYTKFGYQVSTTAKLWEVAAQPNGVLLYPT